MPTPRPRHALAIVLAVLASHPGMLGAQQPAPRPVPQLVVTGYGEIAVAPDRAMIDVAVETRATTAAAAAAQNARRLRVVLDTLKARGVAAGDIATLGYSVNPDYEPTPRGEAVRRGYVATNIIRVETRSLDRVGALLDAALGAGANRVNEVRFSSTRHAAIRDSATGLAIANARRTAESMARAAGGQLGELLEVSTEVGPYAGREFAMRNRVGYAGGVTNQTTIAPDELQVVATIVARWQLIGGR